MPIQEKNQLSQVFPIDVADEICGLSPVSKAMLMYELADDLSEKLDGFPDQFSATTTQWLKALSMKESIQVIENLAQMLKVELNIWGDAMQLDIFSLPFTNPNGELPRPILAIDPKVEEAIAAIQSLKELSIQPESESQKQSFGIVKQHPDRHNLVEGCIVRSFTSYVGKTGKLIRFEEIAGIKFAMVEFPHGLPLYPCTIKTLEVVHE